MALQINRAHGMDKATARRTVEEIAGSLRQHLHFTYRWDGDRLLFERVGVRGHIDVVDHEVRVFVSKSPLLPVSEAWLRQQIETTMDQYIG